MTTTETQYSIRNTNTGQRAIIAESTSHRPLTPSEIRDGWTVIEKRSITYGDWEITQSAVPAPETPQEPDTAAQEKIPGSTTYRIGEHVSVPAPGGGRVSGRINFIDSRGRIHVQVPQGIFAWHADEIIRREQS
jgi:hypothetical protein